MRRDELVNAIGNHVVSCFEKWTENRVGQRIVIPNKIPRPRNLEFRFPSLGDWQIRVTVEAPTLVLYEGPLKPPKYLNLKEALEMIERLEK